MKLKTGVVILCLSLSAQTATTVASAQTTAAAPVATEAVLATTQQTNGKARINILSLKKTEGDTMTLRYVVVNDNRESLYINRNDMSILDLVNRRKYGAGQSSECTVRSDQQQLCWAIFAAPKDNPQTLSVEIKTTGAPPFDLVSVPYSSN
jgi:hypothetical protein